jgi:hypothetical protein
MRRVLYPPSFFFLGGDGEEMGWDERFGEFMLCGDCDARMHSTWYLVDVRGISSFSPLLFSPLRAM